MPQVLLILGALLALVGLGSIAAGAPDWVLGLSLGATLIQSGTIAFVGGLILIGLGLVLYVLQDIVQRLEAATKGAAPSRPAMLPPAEQSAAPQRPAQPGGRQGSAAEGQQRPREREAAPAADAEHASPREPGTGEQPRIRRERREISIEEMEEQIVAARGVPAGGDAARPRRERPREQQAAEFARPRRQPAPPPVEDDAGRPRRQPPAAPQNFPGDEEPRARPRAAENPHEEIPRVRAERPREQHEEAPARPQQRREFAPIPTIPQPFGGEGRRAPEPSRESVEQPAPRFRPAESAPPRPGSETVVRSGVIGGMAYTLYVDGSIEAELPIGTVRFNSIAELQDHVTRTGAEADADFDDQPR